MAAARDRAALSSVAREQEERSIERELRHRFTAGDLGPEDLVKFLRDGEIARLEAGLALLGDLDLLRVRELMHGMNKRGFAALCARRLRGATLHRHAHGPGPGRAGRERRPGEHLRLRDDRLVQQQYDQIRSDRAQMSAWFAS